MGNLHDGLRPVADGIKALWHETAACVGTLSEDGHFFRNVTQGCRIQKEYWLSKLCVVFERNLRIGGVARYRYAIEQGDVGPADGAGFILSPEIKRMSIQRIDDLF